VLDALRNEILGWDVDSSSENTGDPEGDTTPGGAAPAPRSEETSILQSDVLSPENLIDLQETKPKPRPPPPFMLID